MDCLSGRWVSTLSAEGYDLAGELAGHVNQRQGIEEVPQLLLGRGIGLDGSFLDHFQDRTTSPPVSVRAVV